MENVKTTQNNNYNSLVFIPSVAGKYRLLINSHLPDWSYKELDYEPGYEFWLLSGGWLFGADEYIRGKMQVLHEDGTMDESKSGVIAISVNEFKNGNMYSRDELYEMQVYKTEILLNQLKQQGIETYNNILVFSKWFNSKLANVVNLNQSYPDMYRELWNSRDIVWRTLSRELCVRTWNCLLDFRFAQTALHTFLDPRNIKFVDKFSGTERQSFRLFNMPYIPVLAEAVEGSIGEVECVESFDNEIEKYVGFYGQLQTYNAYSKRALITSRDLLKQANLSIKQEVVIVDDAKTPYVPEIFINPNVGETQSPLKSNVKSTLISKSDTKAYVIKAVVIAVVVLIFIKIIR